jgi:hypothetical protein
MVPASLRRPTPGYPLPIEDTVPSWAAGFVGQTGQLAISNETAAAALEVIEACEARDAEARKMLSKKKVFGLF